MLFKRSDMLDRVTLQEENVLSGAKESLCLKKIVITQRSGFLQGPQSSFVEECELSSVG